MRYAESCDLHLTMVLIRKLHYTQPSSFTFLNNYPLIKNNVNFCNTGSFIFYILCQDYCISLKEWSFFSCMYKVEKRDCHIA